MFKNYNIDLNIYNSNFILSSIIDFSDVAKISFENWVLQIEWDNEYEIDEIFWEFMNYVIWLINE